MAYITPRRDRAGNTSWQARIRKAGIEPKTKTFPTEEAAREWAARIEAQIEAGKYQAHSADAVTIRTLIEVYVATNDSSGLYAQAVDTLLHSSLADTPVSQVTKEVVATWAAPLIENATQKLPDELRVLRDVLDLGRTDFDVGPRENPVTALRITNSTPKNRRLSAAEEQDLLNAAAKSRGGYLVDTIILGLETGMMQNEIINLAWDNVDLAAREIRLSKEDGSRIIPLTKRALDCLNARFTPTASYVFPDLTAPALHRSFSRAAERAGIDDLTFNDLRTEAIYRFFEKHYTIEYVKEIIGNKTYDALDRISKAVKSAS